MEKYLNIVKTVKCPNCHAAIDHDCIPNKGEGQITGIWVHNERVNWYKILQTKRSRKVRVFKVHNDMLRTDFIRNSLELKMLENAVVTKVFNTGEPVIDIAGVTTFNYATHEHAVADFNVIQEVIEMLKYGEDPVAMGAVFTLSENSPREAELLEFVKSIAWWMQGQEQYDVNAEVNKKIMEARKLLGE